VFAAFDFK